MKKVLVVMALVLAIPLLAFLVQGIASESGEVVVVRTQDGAEPARDPTVGHRR